MDEQHPLDDIVVPGSVMLVASSGGHLAQLLPVAEIWAPASRHWVTFQTGDAESQLTGEDVTWAYSPTTRNLINLVRNAFLAVRLLRRHRPSVVVSTGAGVAVPFFWVARVMRIPTVYIEVYDRIDSPTLTGRLCAPVTTLMLVQWEAQQALYRGAQVVGPLL